MLEELKIAINCSRTYDDFERLQIVWFLHLGYSRPAVAEFTKLAGNTDGSGTLDLTGNTFVNDKIKKILWQSTGCKQSYQTLLSEKQSFFRGSKAPDITGLAAKYYHFADAAKLHLADSM